MTNMSTLKTTGATGHRDLPLDKLILYIKNVLSNIPIRKKDPLENVLYSGEELKRLVQRFTSDQSNANTISDKELLKPKWSTVAREVTLAILKGLDIFQSPAAAMTSVIVNVAERFNEIPAIDRECIDLLEEMLKLVTFITQIKDRLLDRQLDHRLETISNAFESAVTGAILCHSIIRWKTTTRLPLTKAIREELGYVKDKIRSSDQNLVHEICLLPFKKGGMEENRPPNQGKSTSRKSSGLHAQVTVKKVTSPKQRHISSDLDASKVTVKKVTSPKQRHISSDLDASKVAVISVNMHCEKCKEEVTTIIKKIKGCDKAKVEVDLYKETIIVTGGADPVEIVNTITKKYRYKAKLSVYGHGLCGLGLK